MLWSKSLSDNNFPHADVHVVSANFYLLRCSSCYLWCDSQKCAFGIRTSKNIFCDNLVLDALPGAFHSTHKFIVKVISWHIFLGFEARIFSFSLRSSFLLISLSLFWKAAGLCFLGGIRMLMGFKYWGISKAFNWCFEFCKRATCTLQGYLKAQLLC